MYAIVTSHSDESVQLINIKPLNMVLRPSPPPPPLRPPLSTPPTPRYTPPFPWNVASGFQLVGIMLGVQIAGCVVIVLFCPSPVCRQSHRAPQRLGAVKPSTPDLETLDSF